MSSPTGEQEYLFGGPWTWGDGDPSFFDALAVLSYPALADGSTGLAAAVAPLTWTYPGPRTVTVTDAGATGGASGAVEVDGGVPVSYGVAPNDVMAEIAARFGVTIHDLMWLNPVRGPGEAIAGETLNLSGAER